MCLYVVCVCVCLYVVCVCVFVCSVCVCVCVCVCSVHACAYAYSVCELALSYSTIILYSRDHKGVGMVHGITSPKNQLQFSLTTMMQYWFGKTKPKQVFKSTPNAFNKLLQNFLKII